MSFLGAIGALGRILPGYVEGQRQAVKDNWQDLQNYNTVQGGQLENMFNEAVMQPRISMQFDAAENSRMGVMNNDMILNIARNMYPGKMQAAYVNSMYAPVMATAQNMGQLNMIGNLMNGSAFNMNPYGVAGVPNTPYANNMAFANLMNYGGGGTVLPSIQK